MPPQLLLTRLRNARPALPTLPYHHYGDSVVDSVADTMMLGHGWRFLEHYVGRSVNVRGFDEHLSRKNGLRVGHAVTVTIDEDRQPVLVVAHEAVDNAHNTLSLLSVGQMQASNVQVDTTRFKAGGLQRIFKPISGCVIPLAFQGGMYRLRSRCPTDLELNTLPQVTLT
jgi:hypothetical protein